MDLPVRGAHAGVCVMTTLPDSPLILLRALRRCHVCRAGTRWTVEAWLSTERGVCLDHARGARTRDPVEELPLRLFVRAFPGLEVVPAPTVPPAGAPRPVEVRGRWIRNTTGALVDRGHVYYYPPTYAYPAVVTDGARCGRCERPWHVYGPGGTPWCPECVAIVKQEMRGSHE